MKVNDKIALYANPYPEMSSYLEMVDFAIEHGIKNLEILSVMEFETPDLSFAHKLREYADKKGVKIVCVSKGGDIVVGDDYKKSVENVKRYADVAKILGAQYLHHTIAFEFMDPDKVLPYKDLYIERGIEGAREINEYAKSIGIKTIVEEQGYIFNGIEGCKRLTDSVKDIGILADYGNILQVEERLEDFIPHFSDRIWHVHVKDYAIAYKDEDLPDCKKEYTINKHYIVGCPFGKGDADFERIYEELKKIGYNGYYSMEVNCPSKEQVGIYLDKLKLFSDFLDNHD